MTSNSIHVAVLPWLIPSVLSFLWASDSIVNTFFNILLCSLFGTSNPAGPKQDPPFFFENLFSGFPHLNKNHDHLQRYSWFFPSSLPTWKSWANLDGLISKYHKYIYVSSLLCMSTLPPWSCLLSTPKVFLLYFLLLVFFLPNYSPLVRNANRTASHPYLKF